MYVNLAKNICFDLPFIPLTIGETPFQELRIRESGAECHQFLWVTKGCGTISICDQVFQLTEGHGFFIRKKIPHSYKGNGSNFSTMWITFLGGTEILNYFDVGNYFFFDTPKNLCSSTNHLLQLCSVTFSEVLLSSYGYVWFCETMDTIFKEDLSLAMRVDQYLSHSYNQPLTLDSIAEYVGIDKYSLCHTYSKTTGYTVMSRLKEIRIKNAKFFLTHSTLPIGKIGNMCGFESPSYFIKTFKAYTSFTPKEYRIINHVSETYNTIP